MTREELKAAYRAALDVTPMCTAGAESGWRPCGAPMIPTELHGGNHRAKADERLVCLGCGRGRAGTDAEVKAAHDVERLASEVGQ